MTTIEAMRMAAGTPRSLRIAHGRSSAVVDYLEAGELRHADLLPPTTLICWPCSRPGRSRQYTRGAALAEVFIAVTAQTVGEPAP